MKLLTGENILAVSPSKKLTLTNFRIVQMPFTSEGSEGTEYKSAFLQDLTSFEIRKNYQPVFILLGALFLILDILSVVRQLPSGFIWLLTFLLAGSIVLYFFSAFRTITLATPSVKIEEVLKSKKEDTVDFLLQIQQARLNTELQFVARQLPLEASLN